MTNRNLRAELAAGRFRLDLYHRLAVTGIRVPPLRERTGDLEHLIEYFNPRIADRHRLVPIRFSSAAMELLRAYPWPGNVRELRNVIERAILLATDGYADLDCLTEEIRQGAPPRPQGQQSLESTERRTIEDVILNTGGNLSAAAGVLGISRSTLYRKMDQYGIKRDGAPART
jgi:DNA-binding NtrC family response regulator